MMRRAALACALAALPSVARAQLQLVDMIPPTKSGETHQDSETNLAIDPMHPTTIVGSAFIPMRTGAANGAVFVSLDGGLTWNENEILPNTSVASLFLNTWDTSLKFAGSSSQLYVGYLRVATDMARHLRITNTNDPMVNTTVTDLFPGRDQPDQPNVAAATVMGWFDPGKDRVYVGTDDFGVPTTRSTVDYFLDATGASHPDTTVRVETTIPGSGRDGHQCRPAVHPDGTVYVAFTRWNTGLGANGDIVLVRDDNWGQGTTPFQALHIGPAIGVQVASGVTIPAFNTGTQRGGGGVSIAVDPRNSQTVYVAWLDKMSTDSATLHLQRSTTGGASGSWGGTDLLGPIHNAVNPAVAINSQGRIGLLYQQLVTCGTSSCWETHLRRSDDGTTWSDLLLSRFTDGNPAYQYDPYLGDYENLVAFGHDFYGIFSADNTPDTTHFATGVQFQRNANWTTHQLLDTDNMTPVANSIDPFFFHTTELAPTSDFYVRDWTDSPTVFDHGNEPSTHADFFDFSDVWNERSNTPEPPDPATDRPQFQNPQPASSGPNYGFVRISRAAATTDETVNIHFLFSDGGVGVPYQDAGTTDTSLHFAVGETQKTLAAGNGYEWNLPSGASNHVCLAAQIYTTTDPMIPPGLTGVAPGWPTSDLMVINDNNKAQRNMEVFGFGGSPTAGTPGVEAFALIHNAATVERDMQIGVDADPAVLARLRKVKVQVIGNPQPRPPRWKPHMVVALPKMQPAENRWISVSYDVGPGKVGGPIPLRLNELRGGTVVNGLSIAARALPPADANRENVFQHAAVFSRLAAAFGQDKAKAEVEVAETLLKEKTITDAAYAAFLKQRSATIGERVAELVATGKTGDPFNAVAAAKRLAKTPNGVAHLSLLNRLDAMQTMLQKATGDPADILQMVTWQRDLYRLPALGSSAANQRVVRESQAFIAGYQRRKLGNRDYPKLMSSLIGAFRETARTEQGRKAKLEERVDAIEQDTGSLAALEKAHRDYLLVLQPIARR